MTCNGRCAELSVRVAELERIEEQLREECRELCNGVHATNTRAEAAERAARSWAQRHDEVQHRLDTTHSGHIACKQAWLAKEAQLESEAASLRAKLIDREEKFVAQHAELVALRAELTEVRASCDKAMDEQHAKLVRVADEKRAALAEVERLWAELNAAESTITRWREGKDDAARLATATELLKADDCLWSQWRTEDITEDEDRWIDFTNRAHAHHDGVVAFLANAPAAKGADR